MTQEKISKLREIKEAVFGAVEIIKQIRDPGVQESFGKIMDSAMIVKEITEVLKTPEMVKNIENFRLISENINDAATKMQNVLNQIEQTGVITEAKGLIKSTKSTIESFGNETGELGDMGSTVKGVFSTIRTAQKIIQTVRANTSHSAANEMAVTPFEAEEYLKVGWQHLGTLPNGKVVIKRGRN